MAQPRFLPKPQLEGEFTPFDTAEEAFFWYVQCQLARRDGARFSAGQSLLRPCDPDDIYKILARLFGKGILGRSEMEVLGHFGFQLLVPSLTAGDGADAVMAWKKGMFALGIALQAKGIVRQNLAEMHVNYQVMQG